ncbi:hypothetical protein WQQ_42630 [Hydrocarboniphaga effusa AP103]|uniref:Uncharacterized protein n=1 Tax=Hydrocarboniphaga effusa AP103 TaxID=1172194 RepID=I8T2C1_9GAMM|nr:hypothetical protein WQQ_42630 [Hydrocarboniphaga effusa AP103]
MGGRLANPGRASRNDQTGHGLDIAGADGRLQGLLLRGGGLRAIGRTGLGRRGRSRSGRRGGNGRRLWRFAKQAREKRHGLACTAGGGRVAHSTRAAGTARLRRPLPITRSDEAATAPMTKDDEGLGTHQPPSRVIDPGIDSGHLFGSRAWDVCKTRSRS